MKIRIIILLLVMFCSSYTFAQINSGGQPYSFKNMIAKLVETKNMSRFDIGALIKEDETASKDLPYRFGYGFDVDYNLKNSGSWIDLANGGKLWRLHIKSAGAYSLNLIYNKFVLPDSAKLFIYNVDKSMVIGAFTSRNNKPHGKFATGLVKGDEIILEYYEPSNAKTKGEISISRVIHGYRNLFNFGDTRLGKTLSFGSSGSCNNNVYCPEATSWENEVHSVGMIVLDDGTRICTGSLINNINGNYAPYFLTANHCLVGDVNTWVIWFNYESTNCSNPSTAPLAQTLSGTTLKASSSESDFALIMLDETPPLDYNVFYNGWSNIDTAPTSSVGIHHPSTDIKKISYEYNQAISSAWSGTPSNSHWEVVWNDGTTEGGSSGSPLINQNHKVVGQLHGGDASCSNQNSPDYYGKFSMSWDYGSSSSTRLKDWLDPNNTGASTLNGIVDGMLASGTLPASATWSGTHTLYGNISVPTNVNLTIKSGSTINLNGYKLIFTGGSIVVESGANFPYSKLLNSSNVSLAYYPTIQSAINDAGYQYTVELIDQTYNENVSITNKDDFYLKGAGSTTINGNITITNSDYAYVSDFSIADFKNITLNGGRPYLDNIDYNSNDANSYIFAYDVISGQITELSNIGHSTSSAWNFYNSNTLLWIPTIENYDFGVTANSGSYISVVGSHFCHNLIDLYTTGSTSQIYCRDYILSYDGATAGNVQLSDPVGFCSGNGAILSNSSQLKKSQEIVNGKLREANLAFRELLSDESIRKSRKLTENNKNKVKDVILQYNSVLLENLSKGDINEALRRLSACYRMLNEEGVFADYVSNLVESKSVPSEMKRFLIPSLVRKGNYNEAIKLIDEISDYKDISTDLKYELLYEKGTILKYQLKESELSEKVFAELYKNGGDHILAKYARAQLEEQSDLDDGNKEIKKDNSESNDDFSINSYPNPFNPTTTIAYQIPTDGFVNLVVYNTLGQVVSMLVNEHQTSGKYSVQFNASNLPSGVYFYKIESGSFNKVNKMLLLR
jgi:type IX secretion system substrate protein/trypsin